jgi:hypothetical protein
MADFTGADESQNKGNLTFSAEPLHDDDMEYEGSNGRKSVNLVDTINNDLRTLNKN